MAERMEKGSNGEDMHFVFAPQGSWHMLATETMETVALQTVFGWTLTEDYVLRPK